MEAVGILAALAFAGLGAAVMSRTADPVHTPGVAPAAVMSRTADPVGTPRVAPDDPPGRPAGPPGRPVAAPKGGPAVLEDAPPPGPPRKGKPAVDPVFRQDLSDETTAWLQAPASTLPDRDWSSASAFADAVQSQRNKLFPPGKPSRDADCEAICKEAFKRFAQKFGVFLFLEAELGKPSFAERTVMAMTSDLDAPLSDAIGGNLGVLADRFFELRLHVSKPHMVIFNDGVSDAVRRFKLWRRGWQPDDGYKELTLWQRIKINPMLPFTQNWPRFLNFSVQYVRMDMLWQFFNTTYDEFQRNPPAAWLAPDASGNLQLLARRQFAAIQGASKQGWQENRQAQRIGAVMVLVKLLSSFQVANPASVLKFGPTAGAQVANIKRAGGKVQISDAVLAQIDDAWFRRSGADAGVSATMKLVFDDLAAYGAARDTYRGNLPAFLKGGGPASRC